MADTSRSDSELEKELLYTPEIGKKVRKVRGKYKKTLLKERSRANRVGALDNFIKRKRISDEDSAGEGKRENKRMFTTPPPIQKENKNEVREKGVDSRVGGEKKVEGKMLSGIEELKCMIKGMAIEIKKEIGEQRSEIKDEIEELRKEIRSWEQTKESIEKRLSELEKKIESKEQNTKKIEELEKRLIKQKRKVEVRE